MAISFIKINFWKIWVRKHSSALPEKLSVLQGGKIKKRAQLKAYDNAFLPNALSNYTKKK
jgi:hypothetical protein